MLDKITDWSKVKIAHVKFIFEQAEKRVDEGIKVADTLSSKLYSLITLNLGIWLALCAYIFNTVMNDDSKKYLLPTSVIALIYIFLLLVYLFTKVFPKGYLTSGSQPKDLFVNELFDNDGKEETTTMWLYSAEIKNYQGRIEHNKGLNDKRATAIKVAYIADCILPVILFLVFLCYR